MLLGDGQPQKTRDAASPADILITRLIMRGAAG